MRYFPKKASTAFAANSLVAVTNDGGGDAGSVEPAVTANASLVGICPKVVASSADNSLIPILVPASKESSGGTGHPRC